MFDVLYLKTAMHFYWECSRNKKAAGNSTAAFSLSGI